MKGAGWALWFGLAVVAQAAPPPPEYVLKAKILVGLLPYVQWPDEAAQGDRPFQIAVLGRSPFGPHLDELAKTHTAHRRPIRLRYTGRASEAEGCQAIFICRSELSHLEAVLAWAQPRHVLTLSDDEALAQRGVMMNLLMEGRFVRLAVNQESATAAGVLISSQLLRDARLLSSKRRPF